MSSIDDVERSAALEARSRPLAPASLPGPVACTLGATAGPELALETVPAPAPARAAVGEGRVGVEQNRPVRQQSAGGP